MWHWGCDSWHGGQGGEGDITSPGPILHHIKSWHLRVQVQKRHELGSLLTVQDRVYWWGSQEQTLGDYLGPRDKVEARVNSPVNVSRESCCNNNNTIPRHNDDISIYAGLEKTICKLFLGIESDTWLMCHATPVWCTASVPWPLIGGLSAMLASHWSRLFRQYVLSLLETWTRLGQVECFAICVPVGRSLICLSVNTSLIHPVKSHCEDSRGY